MILTPMDYVSLAPRLPPAADSHQARIGLEHWAERFARAGLSPQSDPAAFRGPTDLYPGGWRAFPTPWPYVADAQSTESQVLSAEVRSHVRAALETLPARQRVVVTLRDVLGHSSDEVCEMLDVSVGNQRVLLHRGRARLREILDHYLQGTPAAAATDG